jgi:hypothetical protein
MTSRLTRTILVALLIASCAPDGGTAGSTSAPPVATTTEPAGNDLVVYMFFDGYPVEPGPFLVPVRRQGRADLASTITALLAGPTPAETETGISSAIPDGTLLLGVEVIGGVARVDVSGEFETGGGSFSVIGRLAQLVYTATRFAEVDSVQLVIDGEPVEVFSGEGLVIDRPQGRSDYQGTLPAILLEEPVWGAVVSGSGLMVAGVAVADSPVHYTLIDAVGGVVARGEVVPAGMGVFSVVVDIPDAIATGDGSVVVFQVAPDGRQVHVLQYPIRVDR